MAGRSCWGVLRLATQVQARTQQQAATKGRSRILLVNAHGRNLAAVPRRLQGADSQPFSALGPGYAGTEPWWIVPD